MKSYISGKVNRHHIFLMGLALFIFGLAALSPINYGGSDSHFSLIVTQSLLDNGTIYLDAYEEQIPEQFATYSGLQLRQFQGRTYYRYPLGTSFFALPFVWAVNQFLELSMLNVLANHLTQNFISALTVAAIFWLIYALSQMYMDSRASVIIALAFTLGSTLMSTMATALWNMNLLVLVEMLAVLLVVRYEKGKNGRFYPYILGLLLFVAFFTRPTAAIFVAILLAYLFWRQRTIFWRAGFTAAFCLLLFVAFSWRAYGMWLPPYYAAGSWIDPGNMAMAFYGLTFSPSRGLFVYSLFLLLPVVGVIFYWSRLKREGLFGVSLLWFGLHVTLVASTRNWWGGYSFGPRLLTDLLPAFVILTILVWQQVRQTAVPLIRHSFIILFVLTAGWAVFIHSYQGLFNWETASWNGSLPPDVDRHPEYIFRWQYPQFLATADMMCQRNLDYMKTILDQGTPLAVYQWGSTLAHDGDQYFNIHGDTPAQRREKELALANGEMPVETEPVFNDLLFSGWGLPQDGRRNTVCGQSFLFLRLGNVDYVAYELSMLVESSSPLTADVYINGQSAGVLDFAEGLATAVVTIPGSFWRANDLNEILLEFSDQRISLRELKIEASVKS